MRHVGEQYWRSLPPALRRNQRPQFCVGHLAHVMMPAASQANCCQMASMSSAEQWRTSILPWTSSLAVR